MHEWAQRSHENEVHLGYLCVIGYLMQRDQCHLFPRLGCAGVRYPLPTTTLPILSLQLRSDSSLRMQRCSGWLQILLRIWRILRSGVHISRYERQYPVRPDQGRYSDGQCGFRVPPKRPRDIVGTSTAAKALEPPGDTIWKSASVTA